MTKVRYEIDLTELRPVDSLDSEVRNVGPDDLEGLAQLMLDAYMGTIDYEDENYDDAVTEVRSFLENDPALEHSYVVELEGILGAAVLAQMRDGDLFIGYVMTHPDHKGAHIGRRLVHHALSGANAAGCRRAVLYITRGNGPSEALFASLGAVAVAEG
ncbi:MAG TPA: GNAT family N-acetyltransferase [Acidimicrobiia bacterium]|nr:GNAT family N-acetyltransferase [Acidimicrobiia bacterium]